MKNVNGILYIVLSSVSFGVMPILAKLAYNQGATTYSVLFLRFIFAVFMILYYLIKNKISLKLTKRQVVLVISLGIFGYSGTAGSLFLAYNYISVGLATMILYTYPIIVSLLSYFIYKEKLYTKKVVCFILSLIGLYALIGVDNVSLINTKGLVLAAMAAVFYSLYVIGSSCNDIKKLNSFVMTFYISVVSAITMGIAGITTNTLSFNLTFYSLVCILLLAFISTVVALMAFLQGVKIIGPSKASILSTLEPIVSLVLGYIILNQGINFQQIIGSILIISAVLLLTLDRKKLLKSN